MKIENVNNVEGLFNLLNGLKGKVELISEEGDRINLKSKLSQMLIMSQMLELIVHEPEDMKKVVEFMMGDAHN